MNSFATQLRQAAAKELPEGAFLRRDRGGALFVTDAPRRCPDADWPARFGRAGFTCVPRDGLVALTPGAVWLARLEAAFPAPPDWLCGSLARFAGTPPDAASLSLFALGARALDGGDGAAEYDRRLRRRAAEALRLNAGGLSSAGGGLYACALLGYLMTNEGGRDT